MKNKFKPGDIVNWYFQVFDEKTIVLILKDEGVTKSTFMTTDGRKPYKLGADKQRYTILYKEKVLVGIAEEELTEIC